jgi:hypothetical protein
MDVWMERLHPPIEDLREAGEVADGVDGNPGLADDPLGATGGIELDAELVEAAGKFNDPVLVGNTENGAHEGNLRRVV